MAEKGKETSYFHKFTIMFYFNILHPAIRLLVGWFLSNCFLDLTSSFLKALIICLGFLQRTNLLGEESVMTEGGCDSWKMTWEEVGEITKPCARGEVEPQT